MKPNTDPRNLWFIPQSSFRRMPESREFNSMNTGFRRYDGLIRTSLKYCFPVIALLALLAALPADAMGVYMSREIEGTIVDAGTGEPIEGVVVTASWILLPWGTTYPLRTLQASETVTNHLGQYYIPGWGPKTSLRGHLEDDQPKIRFFKPGYVPLVIRNNSVYHPGLENDTEHKIKEKVMPGDGRTYTSLYEPEEHQVKFGKKMHTFKLVQFEGTDAEYVKLVRYKYVGSLSYIAGGSRCEWKQLPITFTTLHRLSATLGLPKNRAILFVSHLGGQDRCGNAEEYFREYLE